MYTYFRWFGATIIGLSVVVSAVALVVKTIEVLFGKRYLAFLWILYANLWFCGQPVKNFLIGLQKTRQSGQVAVDEFWTSTLWAVIPGGIPLIFWAMWADLNNPRGYIGTHFADTALHTLGAYGVPVGVATLIQFCWMILLKKSEGTARRNRKDQREFFIWDEMKRVLDHKKAG